MSYKVIYVITVVNDWEMKQMNVKIVFFYDNIEKDVYVVQSINFEQDLNQICKLNKILYDLKQFSRVWFEMLIKLFLFLDYISLNAKNNVFMKNQILIIIYVDDLIMTNLDSIAIKTLKHSLSQRFEMNDFDFCIFYLDMIIFKKRKLRKLIFDQSVYVEQMFQNHEMWNCKSLIILMNVFCRLIKIFDEYIADKSLKINYQSTMKFLMYIMLNIKSNIIYFIFVINRYVFNSTQTHWQAIKQIFRYLRETYQMKLIFQRSLKRLQNYTNFDWVDDQNIKRFILSYAFNINNEIINWFSKRQSIVTLFICEVEYIDQIQIVKKIVWLRNLLTQLICDIDYSQTVIILSQSDDTETWLRSSHVMWLR
jgi:hypothetical protein